jgi:hypothetical protein
MVTLAAVRISNPTQTLYKMLNSKKGTGEMQYVILAIMMSVQVDRTT